MTKVLMVCLGNICRSPLAEGILQSKTNPDLVFVDSAGTAGFHVGDPPDKRAIAVAKKYGIAISQQKCRKFSAADFALFDYIFVMDKNNYENVIAKATTKADIEKVKLLLEDNYIGTLEVPDPYYGGDDGFEKVYQLIDNACDKIVEKLNENGI